MMSYDAVEKLLVEVRQLGIISSTRELFGEIEEEECHDS